MSNMVLYIPTRGRTEHSLTLRGTLTNLPKAWRLRTVVVCPREEIAFYKKNFKLLHYLPQPDNKMSIAQKRKWIFEYASAMKQEKIMMLDDDLSFCPRHKVDKQFAGFRVNSGREWQEFKNKGYGDLYKCTDNEDPKLHRMFERIEASLDKYRHGGIGPRLMSQEQSGEFILNKRAMYALSFHVPTVMKHCVLGRIEHREDFDITLQLLRSGFENAVYFWVTVEQYDLYGAAGGASEERTMKASNADAKKLARLHPGYVKVGMRDYKVSVPRAEVTIRWQLAAEHGQIPELRWSK